MVKVFKTFVTKHELYFMFLLFFVLYFVISHLFDVLRIDPKNPWSACKKVKYGLNAFSSLMIFFAMVALYQRLFSLGILFFIIDILFSRFIYEHFFKIKKSEETEIDEL